MREERLHSVTGEPVVGEPPVAIPNLIETANAGMIEDLQPYFDDMSREQLDCAWPGQGTLLFQACRLGRFDFAGQLLAGGAMVDVPKEDGCTPLHISCCANTPNHYECAKLLFNYRADINRKNKEGFTPMHVACFHAPEDDRKALCFHVLARYELTDVDARDREGKTPLHVLSLASSSIDHSSRAAMAKILLEFGASINLASLDGHTALFNACFHGNHELARTLIGWSADLHTQLPDGCTALHAACFRNQPTCVELLLQARARVDVPNAEERATPLHIACLQGHFECVRLVVGAGASLDMRCGPLSRTPQMAAEANGHSAVVRYLRSRRRRGPVATPADRAAPTEAEERAADEAAAALIADETAQASARDRLQRRRKKDSQRQRKALAAGRRELTSAEDQLSALSLSAPGDARESESALGATGAAGGIATPQPELVPVTDDAASDGRVGVSDAGDQSGAQPSHLPTEPPPSIAVPLAAAEFETGRAAVAESTIGGETTCIVCFTNPKTHLAVPCGHQCACEQCSARMANCPYCRAPASMWIRHRLV